MTSLVFASCLACLFLGRTGFAGELEERRFISSDAGESVALQCDYGGSAAPIFSWYKQTLGQKPQLVSTVFANERRGFFSEEFKNNQRFSLKCEKDSNYLIISDLKVSDSATYFCVICSLYSYEFKEGITVSVNGPGVTVSGSQTLSCGGHRGTTDGSHSVSWVQSAEEPGPGLIYTHGGKNEQSKRKPDLQTHRCVYDVPKQSLTESQAGTRFCAVASCGRLLFGNGTKPDSEAAPDVLVHLLGGALALTTVLCVLMALVVYKLKRRSHRCAESQTRSSEPPTADAEEDQSVDHLHYAALKKQQLSRVRRQMDDTTSACVYSSVRQ